jgi:hypothetical protein
LLPDSGDAIGGLCRQVEVDDREHALLHLSAILACCRRAGIAPARGDRDLPTPAEREDLPSIGDGALQDLDRMLNGDFDEALPDWLAAVAAKGRRVPGERLADLLALGQRQQALRSAIIRVIGRCGRWLAAQNPEWSYALQLSFDTGSGPGPDVSAAPAPSDRLWQTGDRRERLLLLERLRGIDPARASALVASTWTQDPAADRALFLELFVQGLSMEDEPLLESALDDRRKEVRQQAVQLLGRLPGSRRCARMIERARLLLQWTPEMEEQIQVVLPAKCDQAMERDGIVPKPPAGTGVRTWWALQILSGVPLSHWAEQFNRTPAEIVHANRSADWQGLLLEGWTRALQRFPNRIWANLLLDAWIRTKDGNVPFPMSWADSLPQADLETAALRLMETNSHPLLGAHPAVALLSQCRNTWSLELTGAVIRHLRHTLQTAANQRYYIAQALELYAPVMSPAAAEEIHSLWQTAAWDQPYVLQRLERYYSLAQFRAEMLQRIAAD